MSSPAKRSGGVKAVDRYSVSPSGILGISSGVGSEGDSVLRTCMVGTITSTSSSPGWDAEGSEAVDRIPIKLWTVAGLYVASSSYT